jgi:hypothetical protein
LEFELGVLMPVPARISAAYDGNSGKIQTVSSEISIPYSFSVSFGQRYNMPDNIMVFRVGTVVQPVSSVQVGMEVRYDAKGEGLRQVGAYMQYASQCWGVRMEASKNREFHLPRRSIFWCYGQKPKELV